MAGTSLRTKLAEAMAARLTDIVCDAVLTVRKPDEPIDLYMVGGPPHPSARPMACSSSAWAKRRMANVALWTAEQLSIAAPLAPVWRGQLLCFFGLSRDQL